MVFLRDPESKPKPAPAVLRDLYRLTPGEARLAADLLSGSSLQEIAEARRLSRETLRSQLQDLFRKTGTNRQAALINFLATGLAFALHRPEPGWSSCRIYEVIPSTPYGGCVSSALTLRSIARLRGRDSIEQGSGGKS
jgi:DNA-binding CsgD family transcriptional regulator